MKLHEGNRDLVLARQIGYHCGLGDEIQFEFPNLEKAWHEYWPYIKDEARARHWILSSKDAVEREFRRGYQDAVDKKRAAGRL